VTGVAHVPEKAWPGQSKRVTVKGRHIGLFNINGHFYALANHCPHAGGARARAPWSGWCKRTVPVVE